MALKKQEDFTKPASDLLKYLGLDYRAPKLGRECLKDAYKVVPTVRKGFQRFFRLGDSKSKH